MKQQIGNLGDKNIKLTGVYIQELVRIGRTVFVINEEVL